MNTCQAAIVLWEHQQRAADLQWRLDGREWRKNFALVCGLIALTRAIVGGLSSLGR